MRWTAYASWAPSRSLTGKGNSAILCCLHLSFPINLCNDVCVCVPIRPTPSIAELREAADQFCSLSWPALEELYHVERGHSYTYPSQLPHRCLEALYIVTLLEKGFGFDKDSRAITLALEVRTPFSQFFISLSVLATVTHPRIHIMLISPFCIWSQVGGKEVEWTLGFVLAEVGQTDPSRDDEACIDSCLLGELPHHGRSHEGAHFNADYAADTLLSKRTPVISTEDALKFVEMANNFFENMEIIVEQWIEQISTVKNQYMSILKQFVRV